MGESLLLISIITLIVLAIRRAKPVVLDNPLVIERPGQYHITFAPQLNQAQRFVEAVASRFGEVDGASGDLAAQYFEVRDPKVKPRDADCYLLAVARRGGMLRIQAISPQPDAGDNLKVVSAFAEKVLAAHPLVEAADEQTAARLTEAVESVAASSGIAVARLHQAG